jgi:lipoyl(octanoyl) transferase
MKDNYLLHPADPADPTRPTAAPPAIHVLRAGIVPYEQAWEWQRQQVVARSEGRCEDTVLLLQHPPTITLGRAAKRTHILASDDDLARHHIALVQSDRGGDVTYHAPGQLVGYPILKLSTYGGGVLGYIRAIEEVVIRTVGSYGIVARRVEGLTGVWVEEPRLAKIAAIGVRFSASGITSHGFALNVNPDMRGFGTIIPCGIREHGVVSLATLLPAAPPLDEVAAQVIARFGEVFGTTMIEQPHKSNPLGGI